LCDSGDIKYSLCGGPWDIKYRLCNPGDIN
jgi:hypothetical protein